MTYIKEQTLHQRKIKDRQLIIKGDGSIEITPESGSVTINGNLNVTGSAPGPQNSLIIYVSIEGNDSNSGLSSDSSGAKRTIKSAVAAAPPGATIQLAPGDYYEDNPITLKERQTIRGDSLRNTQIWPLNNQSDIFLVDNACYIFQVTFRGLRDPGWCVRIKPGALVTVSPYVQNCTNMNGPWLNDGTEFIPFETVQIEGVQPGSRPIINNPNVPLAKRINETGGGNGMLVDGNEYDQRSLVFSMVADAFTQIAQGGIGFHITNFGYTQIVSCFSVFTRIGFLATKGGYLSISNSVSDFGTFAIIADGLFDEVYTTARPSQDYFSSVGSVTVNNQGAGYASAPVVVIEPPTTPGGVQAQGIATIDVSTGKVTAVSIQNAGSGYNFIPSIIFVGGGFSVPATGTVNLITNQVIEVNSLRDQPQVGSIIQFEGDEIKYYVTNTNVTTQPFIYDETICRRDVRRIVDAVVGDLVMGTNYQALAAARSYLRGTAAIVLQQQLNPTIFGIEAARDEMLARIPDSDPLNEDARYDIIEKFALITNVLAQGDSTSAPDIDYNNLPTIDSGVIAAKDNIVANREFIIEEVTKYIQEQFTELSYNQDNFERDVRLIVEAVAYDVAIGTNYNSVTVGKSYLLPSASAVLDRQFTQTITSFEYLKSLIVALPNVSSNSTALARANAAMDEILEIIRQGDSTSADDIQYPSPTDVLTSRVNAKDQLRANREFIQAEIIAYIENANPTLDYDVDARGRDVGYIVDALTYDLLYGGNSATRSTADSYFVGTVSRLENDEVEPIIEAYERLQNIITDIIQGNTILKTTGNALSQDTSSGNATGVEAERTNELIQIIIDVIEAASTADLPDVLYPSILWTNTVLQNANATLLANKNSLATNVTAFILETYPSFTYDREKCKRDVDLIIDAVARDIRLGTNHNSIVAGQAYLRGTASVVDADQLPATIISLRYLQTLVEGAVQSSTTALTRATNVFETLLEIIEYGTLPSEGTTYPAPGPASQSQIDAARQLQDNKDFLIAETIAWINDNFFIYDAVKAARDSQLIIDAVALDLVLGTNYNSVAAGLSFYTISTGLINDQTVETIAAITHLKSQVATLIASSASSVTRINAAFDEIVDIIQNGVGSADALTWTNPGIDANKLDARVLLQTNRTLIINDLINWIDTNYPSLVYSQPTKERDIGYLIDAISHDVQYGTNLATKAAAELYFENNTSVLPIAEKAPTSAAYTHLADIAAQVVIENYPGQTTTGNPASSTEMDEIAGLIAIVTDAIDADEVNGLSADVEPDLSWVNSEFTDSRNLILASGDSTSADLMQSVVDYVNETLNGLSYSEESFSRDTGYLINAVTHDLLYGGNRSTLISARSYFYNDISTIIGQEVETAAAFEHLRDVSTSVIEGAAVVPTTGNTETQSLVGGFGTSTDSGVAEDLYNIVITAISDSEGLLTTPENQNPNYIGISVSVAEAAENLLNSSATFQQNVIDYITNNIIGFSYNIEKCGRDTGYIVDAAVYDMMYGGNKQTRRAAEAYYNSAILGNAVIGTTDQVEVTEFTYKHLADILSKISQNIEIVPSEGVTLTQTIGITDGSLGAASNIFINVSKIAEVVKEGNTALPIEIDHSYSVLGNATLNSKRLLILNDLSDIEDEAIRLLNLEFGGIAELTLFPGVLSVLEGTLGNMQNVSTVSTAGHAFEYVGAGITYNALPFFGGTPIEANNFVESNSGKVFAGGVVDQIGNFKVGNFFTVNALTGAITLNANQLNLTGLSSIGPFQRNGIPVGVELKEVSDSTNLVATTGVAAADTVPTQNAVVQYVENRYLNKLTGGTVNGNVIFDGDIAVNGGNITTINTVFNLIDDNANVVNFARGATQINIGAPIGTTTINNDVVVDGTLDVNGDTTIIGDFSLTIPDETQQAFNITQGTEDYISIDTRETFERVTFGDQPRIEIDNVTQAEPGTIDTGALVVAGGAGFAKNVSIGGDLYFEGTTFSTNSGSLSFFDNAAGTVSAFGAATEIEIGSSGIIPGNFVINNDYIRFTSVYNLKIPTGSTGERGDTPTQGYIRFNTDIGQFEGYDGIAWNTLGGVRDVDGNTYIITESSPGANENELMFYTDGLERMNLSVNTLRIDDTITTVSIEGTTESNSPASGVLQIAGGVGIEKNLNVRGNLRVYNNTLVEGSLVATGDVTLGTIDSVVDQLTVNANSQFNVWDNTTSAFDVSESGNSYFRINTTNSSEQVVFGSTPVIRIQNTTESNNSTTGALVVAGGLGVGGNLYVAGGLTVTGSIVFGDNVNEDTFTVVGDTDFTIPDNNAEAFRIDEGTNNYFNVSTINGTELISFGSVPKLTINNTTDSTADNNGALVVAGGVGIGLNLNVGVDLTVDRNAIIAGDLEIRGGDLTTDQTTFNLLDTTATTVNAFGAATAINIGAATGTVTISNQLTIFDSVQAIQIPVGTNLDRPTPVTGQIRYNTDTQTFEGYGGTAWGSLGGVKDVDQDTYIQAETGPGTDEDTLQFFTAGTERLSLSTSAFTLDSTIDTLFESTTGSSSVSTGAVVINGGVGIAENLYVGGRIGGDIQIGENISNTLTIRSGTVLAPDSLRLITNAPDSAADDIVYPITLAHHSISGTPVAGSGTGIKFELETANDNFETGGQIDIVAQDLTGSQEDFDMIFSTMISGSVVEKLRLGENTSTFSTDITINNNQLLTTQTTFNLLDDTATTINFAGAATVLNIGATGGLTTIDQSVQVNENVTIDGTLALTNVDLAVQYGGTGVSTFTTDGILYGNAANAVQVTDAAGTSDVSNSFQILTVVGSGDNTPVWTDTIDGGTF